MKNKFFLLTAFFIIFSALFILPTKSFGNIAQSSSIEFSSGEWIPAETFVDLESVTSYVDPSGEHYQLEVGSDTHQFLSFRYKLNSSETAVSFDQPSVVVYAGQTPILQISANTFDDLWHLTYIDLAKTNLSPGFYDLNFEVQNTYDDFYMPNFQIKDVTTKTLILKSGDKITFSTSKKVDHIGIKYSVTQNNEELPVQQEINFLPNSNNQIFEFIVPPNVTGNEITYWSVDLFDNIENEKTLNFHLQDKLGASNFETQVFPEIDNELNLQIQYLNESDDPKYFDLRISQNLIETDNDWGTAQQILEKQHHQFFKANVPEISTQGIKSNNLLFSNFSKGSQYISAKICNEVFFCEYILQNYLVEYK